MVTSKQPATLLSKAHGAKGKHKDPAHRTWSAADVLGPSYAAACAWQPRWAQGKIQNKSQEWTFVIVLEEGGVVLFHRQVGMLKMVSFV